MAATEDNHITDWLPGYLLDALADEEMHQVRQHLVKCSICQAELARLQAVLDELPLAVMQATPPPMLKLSLMQAIHTRSVKPASPADHPSIHQRLSGFLKIRWPAFGLALIIVLVLANLWTWQQLNQANQHANIPLRVVNLTTSQFFPGALGAVVINPDSQYATLVVDNLTVLAADKQYQVWLIKGADRISAGVFSVNVDGHASVAIKSPQPLQIYDAIGVSVEPAGGSTAPTGENVFHGFLAK